MARRPRAPEVRAGIHRGIHYVLQPNAAPGYWRYGYAIGERVRSGRVQGRLPLLAIRRVCMCIDRDMRSGRAETTASPGEIPQDPGPAPGFPNDD